MKSRRDYRWILIVAAMLAGSVAPATAEHSEWSVRAAAVFSTSAANLADTSELGAGVAAEYRVSPRVGLGISAYTSEFDDDLGFDFFDFPIRLEQSFRMTPVLAELLFHLTPDSRVDFYVGPVGGYVAMSDLTLRFSAEEIGMPEDAPLATISLPLESQWAWGATLGMNIGLGSGKSFLALGVTHLRTRLEVDLRGADIPHRTSLEPLSVHLGYGVRF